MQKIAASVFAAIALHGCDKQEAPAAVRGSDTAQQVKSIQDKAMKKAQQFVKTAKLNAVVTDAFNRLKKTNMSPENIKLGTEDLKKWAITAQNEVVRNEKQIEQLIPEFKNKALTYLKDNHAEDFIKSIESHAKKFNPQDIAAEAEGLLKGTEMFNQEQMVSFHNLMKSTMGSVQHAMGSSPLTSKHVQDLTNQVKNAQHQAIQEFEKVPIKQWFENAIKYELEVYKQVPYDKIAKGAKELRNNITEQNVQKELQIARNNIVQALA